MKTIVKITDRKYKLRRVLIRKHWYQYTFAVPPDIAVRLPKNAKYEIELTDEGVLYRPS